MGEVFEAERSVVDALAAAEEALAAGGTVVFPTDTVYGLGAHPDVRGATQRIFEIKRRPANLTLPVLVAGTADAESIAVFDERAMTLAHEFWPGGLTLVLPRADASTSWELGDHTGTIGLRVPASGVAVALLARTGPLAVTSANLTGEPTPETCEGVRDALGDAVEVYLCGGPSDGGTPSTVIDLSGEDPAILRAGAIPPDDVLSALARA